LNIESELKLFNSVIRFSFNRFQEGFKEKEVRAKINSIFIGNSWLLQCALKVGAQLFKKHKDKKIIFGGKNLLNRYINKLITKDEFKLLRMNPLNIQGEACKKGNRLFNFDFYNSKLIFKISKINHKEIEFYKPRGKYFQELIKLQELVDNKQIALTVSLNKDFVFLTYDEGLINIEEKFIKLKNNRIIGIDLNPNFIGLSVLEFNKNDEFKIIHKQVFNLLELNKISKKSSSNIDSIYLTNKRTYELIQICYKIKDLINIYKSSKLVLEDLNIKSSNKHIGKYFNRLCNNVWKRNLVINKMKMLGIIYGFEIVEVNPAYTSVIGNMLYGNKTTPDMIASSIEIARRGFKKYTKGWFYPNVDNLDEQWKQTLNYSESTTWKELFNKIKNLKLKYRVQLNEIIQNAVFSKFYIKRNYSVYQFN